MNGRLGQYIRRIVEIDPTIYHWPVWPKKGKSKNIFRKIEVLSEIVISHPDTEIKNIATSALTNLDSRNPVLIDFFCAHWLKTGNEFLKNIIIQAGYVARQPHILHLRTASLTGKTGKKEDLKRDIIEPLIKECANFDHLIATNAQEALNQLQHPEAIEIFCDYLMEHEDINLIDIAKKNRYVPKEESKRALFLFITKQWDLYEVLDFQENRPLLKQGYAHAPEWVRRRLLVVARDSGKITHVAEILVRHGRRHKILQMVDNEWKLIIESFKSENRFEDLWKVIFIAPVEWAAEALLNIRDTGWSPGEKDIHLWRELVNLCPQEGRALILNDRAPYLLLDSHNNDQIIQTSSDSAGQLIISPDSQLIVHKIWAFNDTSLLIWKIFEGTYKEIQVYVSSKLFITQDSKSLITSGHSSILLWELPSGKFVSYLFKDFIHGDAVFSNNMLYVAHGTEIHLCKLPEEQKGKIIDTGHEYRITKLAISSDGQFLASASLDETVRVWRVADVVHLATLERQRDGITCINISPQHNIFISGGYGNINIWWNNEVEDSFCPPDVMDDPSITTYSPDGKYFAYSSNRVIHIWRRRWVKPIALTNYDDLIYIQKILHEEHLDDKEKRGWQFLEAIIKAKFRFDITLDEKVISLGEYDIEIDD